MTEELWQTVQNMRKYGGSFVKALAECFLRADPINTLKLESTFKDILEQYKPKKEGK